MIATVNKIASNRSVGRAEVLREALVECAELQANVEESERQMEAGETISHEEMVAWLQAQYPQDEKAVAA